MKILITGGAGFIGSNFIYYIQNKYPDYELVCLDMLTYAGNLENLEKAFENPAFTFVRGDISDRQLVFDLFSDESFDIVVNFAAESHVDRSIENSELFLKTNIIGTQVLMDACKFYGIKRFHQVSTDEVYGDLPLDEPEMLFKENTPIRPSSPYSASKAAADLLVLAYNRTYNLPVTISRCSNNYGPFQFPEKLIPLCILHSLQDKYIPVYGNGKNIRDWIYVEDHCSAIDVIIHDGEAGQIYNIGGNNEKANISIVTTILDELHKPQNLIEFVTDRPGHDLRYAIDSTKMRNQLNWVPLVSFEDGIRKTIEWYLTNKMWQGKIFNI
ncbi:MAG: dTDP-glucose 4,6-dehydratase [Oscillospiraceae bacterium]|nr:dTDP-glucose 4,6-dehydratase [Oscillospiraceae bacterium]